ncbi:ead/Ea22-like family protein [Enterobacter asburiae]|uniref:ead/Ea22-like family protein n=1 Tax=Enterobacter asburiae TaxID=61645 RepID=UPI002967067D|nr:ead/Ea22-like family protein [Enterobacter asburiae]MDW3573813.1 ead/Ea22-like family protein [Enterobacter asburiae]
MSNIDKQALREAAEKATPGDWKYSTFDCAITDDTSSLAIVRMHGGHINDEQSALNGAFIAASNPATVLALLDELEAKDKRIAEQVEIIANQEKWIKAVEETMITATDRAEAAEKRITELSVSHSNLRDAMAGIHNTIKGGGAYTPLAAILNASKRAYEESAAAAGKGEAS